MVPSFVRRVILLLGVMLLMAAGPTQSADRSITDQRFGVPGDTVQPADQTGMNQLLEPYSAPAADLQMLNPFEQPIGGKGRLLMPVRGAEDGATGKRPAGEQAADGKTIKDQLPLKESQESTGPAKRRDQGVVPPVVSSALEKQIGSDDLLAPNRVTDGNPAKDLQQFGYTFFRDASYASAQDLPVSADYLLASGDSLVVTVWGAVNGTYEVSINRSGEIVIPKIGPVKLAGLPFGAVREVLKNRLAHIYREFDVSVSMGRLRTIKVYVVGEVHAPGDYSISGLATVINALGAAGGPTKNGSLRNIRVRRAAGGEEQVDLYEFFTRGDKSRDIRLQSGDAIFVPVIGRVAAIAGNVKRPAIYELKDERSLRDLIALAEGVTVTGNLQRVQISRVIANDKKSVLDINLDPQRTGKSVYELAAGVAISDMDVVRVFAISGLLRGHVRIIGHVERPGYFACVPGQRISSVLTGDQLLPEYHAETLEITRLVPPDLHPEKRLVSLKGVLAKDPQHDLQLQEFDTLRVFSRWDLEERLTVRVSGEVQQPGEYRYFTGMTVRDLLVQAGNPKASAYLRSAEVSRLNRSEAQVRLEPHTIDLAAAVRGDVAHNLVLAPYDELNVRRIPNWSDEKERYVTLVGEFMFPGTYPVYKGERLSSVIARAGGFSENAYLPGAKFTRETVRKLQQQRLDESLQRAQEEVIKKQSNIMAVAASKEELESTKATLEGLERSINLLRGKKAEGRVIIRIASQEKLKGSVYDVEVEGGDSLYIPSDPASVNVLGSVYNPTTVLYEPFSSVNDYLQRVGGVTKDGDADEIYLVKADGTVFSRQQASSFFFFDSFGSRIVESGDTIVIPQKIERVAWLRDIKDLTTIISQIAISAGTVILGLR
jgi:protein involved in polysaccharide export with SLBB domain